MSSALLENRDPDLEVTVRVSPGPAGEAGRRYRPPGVPGTRLLTISGLDRAGAAFSATVVAPVGELSVFARRLAGKAERLLDETLALLVEIRPLVPALVRAVEDGLLDEISGLTHDVRRVLPALGRAIEAGLLDDLDATLTRLESLPETQDDVRTVVETLQTLVGLTTITLDQLEAIPGAGLVRRRISKALADAHIGPYRDPRHG